MDKDSTEELKTAICSEINRIRKEQNLTIEQMAEQTSLDYTSLFRICHGQHLPKLITLVQISKTYNIPIAYWFRNIDKLPDKEKLQQQTQEAMTLKSFNKLDKNLRDAILELIRGYKKRQ